jgi:uncharacterized protein (DUF433 family)
MVPEIISDPAIMCGKPVLKGTRLTVECVLERIRAGMSVDELQETHEALTPQAVQVCLDFAAQNRLGSGDDNTARYLASSGDWLSCTV